MEIYHLMQEPWLEYQDPAPLEVVYNPSIPQCIEPDGDMETLRICVAPTIKGCLTSIGIWGSWLKHCQEVERFSIAKDDRPADRWCVYVPGEVVTPYSPTPEQVHDVADTGELWLLEPTPMVLSGIIEIRMSEDREGTLKMEWLYVVKY